MKCEACGCQKHPPKKLYWNNDWTVIENLVLKDSKWVQVAYRTQASVREYRVLAQVDDAWIDVVHSDGDSEANKRMAYGEFDKMTDIILAKS